MTTAPKPSMGFRLAGLAFTALAGGLVGCAGAHSRAPAPSPLVSSRPVPSVPVPPAAVMTAPAPAPVAAANAQSAPEKSGPGSALGSGGGPTDVTADQLEVVNGEHLAIWKGHVEAVQNGKRLVADVLNVYFDNAPPTGAGAAGAAASHAPTAKPAAAAPPAGPEGWGQINHMVADGHVFFVTESQSARGEHAVYVAASDTLTMTGNVVVVQGDNVVKGDKMVMQMQTGHTDVISNTTGRNKPERVRGVFYNDNQSQAPAAGAPAAGAAAKPAAASAKKPATGKAAPAAPAKPATP